MSSDIPPSGKSLRGRKLSKVPARSLALFLGTSSASGKESAACVSDTAPAAISDGNPSVS